jgi:hypothetical protein
MRACSPPALCLRALRGVGATKRTKVDLPSSGSLVKMTALGFLYWLAPRSSDASRAQLRVASLPAQLFPRPLFSELKMNRKKPNVGKIARVETAGVAKVLPALGQPRAPDDGEALWQEFVAINRERGSLNLNATENQRQTLVVIAKLRRYHGPRWSYFLASKNIKRQRNAVSDYHPIVMHALGISSDRTGRARPLTVALDEWERSGKEPTSYPSG